jgi:hypothetical protein
MSIGVEIGLEHDATHAQVSPTHVHTLRMQVQSFQPWCSTGEAYMRECHPLGIDAHRDGRVLAVSAPGADEASKISEDDVEEEEELYLSGNTLVRARGGRVLKSVTVCGGADEAGLRKLATPKTPSNILHAVWATFPAFGGAGEAQERALVVLGPDMAHVYYTHGAHLVANMPFRVRQAWALHPLGLLLEREADVASSADLPLPRWFSWMHPLEEVKMVSCLPQHSGVSCDTTDYLDPTFAEPCSEVDEHIVWCGILARHQGAPLPMNLVLAYHAVQQRHILYELIHLSHLEQGRAERARDSSSHRQSKLGHPAEATYPHHARQVAAMQDPVLCGMDVDATTSIGLIHTHHMTSVLFLRRLLTLDERL